MTNNILGNLPDEYWNRTPDNMDDETTHPYVGKNVKVTTDKYYKYYNKIFTVTRAYDSKRGVCVRIDFHDRYNTTLTLMPDEYQLRHIRTIN